MPLIVLFIDARTGQILHVDIKRLCDLTADGQKLDFNPAYALGNLYLLLSGLRQHIIEEGQYILKHDVSSGAFVKILKAGDNVEDNIGDNVCDIGVLSAGEGGGGEGRCRLAPLAG